MKHSKLIHIIRKLFTKNFRKSVTGYALLSAFIIAVSAMAGCAVSAKSYIADASQSQTVQKQMMPGDADRDGSVDLTDAQLILRRALKIINVDEAADELCDVNGDGSVNLDDAQITLKYALKIIKEFPSTYPVKSSNPIISDIPMKSESPIISENPIENDIPQKSEMPSETPVVSIYPAETEDTTTENKQMKIIQLKINDQIVPVQWENNESADALLRLLEDAPLTINMSMYGGFEQVGSLGTNLVRNDKQTTTETGDIVLYSGNSIVMFYGSNSWTYTRLGKIEAPESEIIQLLSNGNVTVTLTAVMEN